MEIQLFRSSLIIHWLLTKTIDWLLNWGFKCRATLGAFNNIEWIFHTPECRDVFLNVEWLVVACVLCPSNAVIGKLRQWSWINCAIGGIIKMTSDTERTVPNLSAHYIQPVVFDPQPVIGRSRIVKLIIILAWHKQRMRKAKTSRRRKNYRNKNWVEEMISENVQIQTVWPSRAEVPRFS